jgi:hypothetical protein
VGRGDTPGDDRRGVWWSGVDVAIAEAPMKAQRRFGLALSWPPIASAFLVGVAVLVLASQLPYREPFLACRTFEKYV